jgi:hypothetical protein
MERYWYATCDHELNDHTLLKVVGEYEVGSPQCTWTLEPTDQATAEPGELVLEFLVTCPEDAEEHRTVLQIDYSELDPVEYDRVAIIGDHTDSLVIEHLGTMGDSSDVE